MINLRDVDQTSLMDDFYALGLVTMCRTTENLLLNE